MSHSFASERTGEPTPRPSPETANDTGVPRIIVVSDVRLYREGLALGLAARPELCVVGTAATCESACELVTKSAATVVLLDSGMPCALDFARQLLRATPSVRVVAVAVHEDGPDIVACAEAGLSGYVPRDGSMADAVSAIIDATQNVLHCPPRVTAALFKRLSATTLHAAPADEAALTPREQEVVKLIDHGLSNKEIAQRLCISTATVKNHVHNLLEKLRVCRRAEAAAHVRSRRMGKTAFASTHMSVAAQRG